jgi:hypothetical protein
MKKAGFTQPFPRQKQESDEQRRQRQGKNRRETALTRAQTSVFFGYE